MEFLCVCFLLLNVKIIDNSKEMKVFFVKLFNDDDGEGLEFIMFFCIYFLVLKVKIIDNNKEKKFFFVKLYSE